MGRPLRGGNKYKKFHENLSVNSNILEVGGHDDNFGEVFLVKYQKKKEGKAIPVTGRGGP
jgi:hypothetical protein